MVLKNVDRIGMWYKPCITRFTADAVLCSRLSRPRHRRRGQGRCSLMPMRMRQWLKLRKMLSCWGMAAAV
jgi:hypothetical protein